MGAPDRGPNVGPEGVQMGIRRGPNGGPEGVQIRIHKQGTEPSKRSVSTTMQVT